MLDRKLNVAFLHLEKTGGTSVVTSLWGRKAAVWGPPDWDNPGGAKRGLAKHRSLEKLVQDAGGPERWDAYFSFTIVRNPWDRLVSKWYWRHKRQKLRLERDGTIPADWFRREMEECRSRWRLEHTIDEFQFGDHDAIPVDRVLRFESLAEDWGRLVAERGWTLAKPLPHINRSQTRARDYRRYYTRETADIVRAWAPKTIAAFGYTF